jgi:hypothetical protein
MLVGDEGRGRVGCCISSGNVPIRAFNSSSVSGVDLRSSKACMYLTLCSVLGLQAPERKLDGVKLKCGWQLTHRATTVGSRARLKCPLQSCWLISWFAHCLRGVVNGSVNHKRTSACDMTYVVWEGVWIWGGSIRRQCPPDPTRGCHTQR